MDSRKFGLLIRGQRKKLKLRQSDVSLSTGIGTRFISNLENGKPTCELGKAIEVLESLGLVLSIHER
jgi:y4mF family transcriptional regulator